jgi:hypothetical protein
MALTFTSLIASASGTHPATVSGVPAAQQLQDFHRLTSTQGLGLALRVAGLLLVIPVGPFWCDAARGRGVTLWERWMPRLTVLAPVLLSLALIAGFFALRHVAAVFAASGVHTNAHAQHLINSSGALRAAAVAEVAARIVFGVWVLALARVALRAELLTGALGYFGIGAGIATMIPGLTVGDALFAGWISSLSLIAIGWWPGGRPEAWNKYPRR